MYEIPLSTSQKCGHVNEELFQESWEEDGHLTQEPTYMNFTPTPSTYPVKIPIINKTYFDSHREQDREISDSRSVAV